MYKKSFFGHILLFILVISGFAGTFHSNTISKEERKFVVTHLKESKKELLKSVKGLTDAQLNFKPGAGKWSVKECVMHIILIENSLWDRVEKSLAASTNPEKRSEIKITDDQLLKEFSDRTNIVKTANSFYPEKAKYNNMDEAVDAFKQHRSMMINYMKSSNADFRNHVIQIPLGLLDAYQVCLAIAANNNRYLQQINEVKASPGYPKF